MAEKVCEDGTTDLDEAVLNQFLNAVKVQVKVNYFAINFTSGSAPTAAIAPAFDSDGEVVDADVSWDVGDNHIDITLSGYSNNPIVFATIGVGRNLSTNIGAVQAMSNGAAEAQIRFVGAAAGDNVALEPDGDMRVNVLVIGF